MASSINRYINAFIWHGVPARLVEGCMDPDPAEIARMFETVSLGAPRNAVGFVMWRVVHRYQREVEQALRGLELTHLQFITLALAAWLARDGGAATQAGLARAGDIHPMQVSNVVKALEHKRLVRRRADAANPLAKRVAITTAGLAALRAALPIVIDVQGRIFGAAGSPGGSLLQALLQIDQGA
jgi:DNA-binding MarR family transcriptional regulator